MKKWIHVRGDVMNSTGILVTGEEKNIALLSLGSCPSPVAIAIGGGGKGNSGGGGSGHVAHTTYFPQRAYIKMTVHPGSGGEDSYVLDLATKSDIVRGRKGQDGGRGNGD